MKKRKSRKQIKFVFIAAIILFAVFLCLFYFYPEKDSVKEYVSKTVSQLASQTLELPAGHLKKEAGKQPLSQTENFIKLPSGLELPLCPAKKHAADHEIRMFENYTICYRESYEEAEWSAYRLCDYQLEKNAARSNDFRPDPEISTASALLSDYKKSGYDRGHLTPAADMAFSEKAMSETFFMSNMSPQLPQFNRGIWKDLEAQVRIWAEKFGRLYIVSGPVLAKSPEEYESIGENRVAVPDYFYKVILVPLYEDEQDRKSGDDSKKIAAIGFIIPNKKCDDAFWNYAVSIDEAEKITGLDFYSALEDKAEERAEASFDLSLW